ncbi:High-affinity glucose transporter [Fonsecaea pedrosoi]|nr:High-affinity glucose transporter [Fonsecaea pedrosoi]
MPPKIGNIYLITAIAVIGGGLFGADIASMSAILGTNQYRCYFNQGPSGPPFNDNPDCSGPTAVVQGGVNASMPGGSFIACIVSGYLSDHWGRKSAIQIGSVIWILGCVVTCAVQNIAMLVVGRFICGFAVGICSSQVPVYVSELAPPSRRGRIVICQQFAITCGITIMYFVSYGSSFLTGSASFRLPWGAQALPAVLLGIGLMFTPESPRYLAHKDRWEETHEVLALVHGNGDRSSPFVQRELHDIREFCESERNQPPSSYLELFKPKMLYRTHIGVFMQIWSQLSGVNVMMYYITYVFGMAGLSGNVNLYSSSITYVINMCMTLPALMWIDVWGRRWPLILESASMAVWMFLNAALMAGFGSPAPPGGVDHIPQQSWQIHGAASKALIASTFLFVASFAVSVGPISWIYPPEVFPLRLRGKGVAVCVASNWIFNFALSWFVPPAFVNIKWKVYLIFGVFLIAMGIHFFFVYPETAGKTLEEVENIFATRTKAWKTRIETKKAREIESASIRADDPEEVKDAALGYVAGRVGAEHVEMSITETTKS